MVGGSEPQDFEVLGSGETGGWMSLAASRLSLGAGEKTNIKVQIRLPETLKPGLHKGGVLVIEAAPPGATLAARAGVESQVWVNVPYPPVWMELGLSSEPGGSRAKLKVELSNPAVEPVAADIKLHITGPEESDLELGRVSLAPGESKLLEQEVSGPPGRYNSAVTANWSGGSNQVDSAFHIGEFHVAAAEADKGEVIAGRPANLTVNLTNMWFERMEQVQTRLLLGGLTYAGPTVDLRPFESREVIIPFQAPDKEGEYPAMMLVGYANKQDSVQLGISVVKYPTALLAAAGVAGLLLLGGGLVMMRDRKKGEGQ